jgi:NAD(P)-dependent dehydrogenase (short-subunit alcohol dehydrogenase family)
MTWLQSRTDLSGQIAVITGGAGRLGTAFATALTEQGAHVCLLDVAGDRAAERASALCGLRADAASAWTVDLSDESAVADTVAAISRRFGRIDLLINNAAYPPGDLPPDGLALAEQRLDQWRANLDVLLTGPFLITRAAAPWLQQAGNGRIVNIASIYGLTGVVPDLYAGTAMANEAYYAAGKGGLIQLTRYWATLLAPAVRVNAVAPGGLAAGQPESFVQRYEARTPLGRMAQADDVVGAMLFLATDLSAYVTGQVLAVDGGWTAW